MKKITLFGLSLAGLALLAFPHSGQAFELKEEWPTETLSKSRPFEIICVPIRRLLFPIEKSLIKRS